MNVGIIIQARMTSTRLPGKVLAPILGRPMLAWQIGRMRRSRLADDVVVATTTNATDDPVADLARSMDVGVFRGSEDDVLSRYIEAAHSVPYGGSDVIVRATADCPLLDPHTVDMVIARYQHGDADHVELRGMPDGMGCEVVSRALLEEIAQTPDITAEEREHVTLYVRRRPQRYRKVRIDIGHAMDGVRWTVDTAADLALVTRIFEALDNPKRASFEDIRAVVAAHPEWTDNAEIQMGPVDREMLTLVDSEIAHHAPWLGDL